MTSPALLRADADVVRVLDPYAGGLAEEAPRLDAIATISAGYKDGNRPVISRDQTIHLHDPNGRAPALKAALEATGGKQLTIAFPWDDDRRFVTSWLARYSATRLEAHGDQYAITLLGADGTRTVCQAGTEQYTDLLATMKPYFSIYFVLARWDEDGHPRIMLQDGYGYYRLRTTSRNSIRSMLGSIRAMQAATQGRIAGIPFDLTLVNQERADPTGAKRTVPIWSILVKKPGGLDLDADGYRATIAQGLQEGAKLLLPSPTGETIEAEARELPDDLAGTLDEEALVRAATAPTCDKQAYCAQWFAAVKGTVLDTDEARAGFVTEHTKGRTDSLKEFLEGATDLEAADLIYQARMYLRANEPVVVESRVVDSGGHPTTTEEEAPTPPTPPSRDTRIDPEKLSDAPAIQRRVVAGVAKRRLETPTLARKKIAVALSDTVRGNLEGFLKVLDYGRNGGALMVAQYLLGVPAPWTWTDMDTAQQKTLTSVIEHPDHLTMIDAVAHAVGLITQHVAHSVGSDPTTTDEVAF